LYKTLDKIIFETQTSKMDFKRPLAFAVIGALAFFNFAAIFTLSVMMWSYPTSLEDIQAAKVKTCNDDMRSYQEGLIARYTAAEKAWTASLVELSVHASDEGVANLEKLNKEYVHAEIQLMYDVAALETITKLKTEEAQFELFQLVLQYNNPQNQITDSQTIEHLKEIKLLDSNGEYTELAHYVVAIVNVCM
jgi:hypothetical protein